MNKKYQRKQCNLKKYRQINGYSRKKLSDVSGVSLHTIIAWEEEERYPTFTEQEKFIQLAKILNCRPDELLPDELIGERDQSSISEDELDYLIDILKISDANREEMATRILDKCWLLLERKNLKKRKETVDQTFSFR